MVETRQANRPLLLGVDAGGTKTVAWLARDQAGGEPHVIGRGRAGGANPQAVGLDAATGQLDAAVAEAFLHAGTKRQPVAVAVVAVAGSDRPQTRAALEQWSEQRRVAERFHVVHDALPVLAAGTSDGWGVALVAGTGSFVFGQDASGNRARVGGWGFLFGDEGSAYAIALAGLRAASHAADGRAAPTLLLELFQEHLGLARAEQLIEAIYPRAHQAAWIASLAPVVTRAAEQGDERAEQILRSAAAELAQMVATVARKLQLPDGGFPLAMAGGLLAGCDLLRKLLPGALAGAGCRPARIALVTEPVRGTLRIAQMHVRQGRIAP